MRAGVAAGVLAVVGLTSTLSDEKLREHGCATTMTDWMPSAWPALVRESGSAASAPSAGEDY